MMARVRLEIEQTLLELGVVGAMTFECCRNFTSKVFVNGEYFGVWDVLMKKFTS